MSVADRAARLPCTSRGNRKVDLVVDIPDRAPERRMTPDEMKNLCILRDTGMRQIR